jgi:hypothetical protein
LLDQGSILLRQKMMVLPTLNRSIHRRTGTSIPVTANTNTNTPVIDQRIEGRYETIESWIISKKVNSHNENCDPVQKAMSAVGDIAVSADDNDNDTDDAAETEACDKNNECPICMECFQVDETVSWSPNANCVHAFHHQCIKEWLLRHGKCPCCREVFLPIDEHEQILDKEELRGLAKQRSRRISTTYCCLRDGLVTVRRSGKDNLSKDIRDRIDTLTCPSIKKGELSKLRGSRLLEGNSTANNGGDNLGGPSMQVLNPLASLAGPNFGSSGVVITSTARNEQRELDSEIIRTRAPATAEDRNPAVQLSPPVSSMNMANDVDQLRLGPGCPVNFPGFARNAPPSLKNLMMADPSVAEFLRSMHAMENAKDDGENESEPHFRRFTNITAS